MSICLTEKPGSNVGEADWGSDESGEAEGNGQDELSENARCMQIHQTVLVDLNEKNGCFLVSEE